MASVKKALTQDSINLFTACGLVEAEYKLLSNSVAKDAMDVDLASRPGYVKAKLKKAQDRAQKSAEFNAIRQARRSEFKVVLLPAKPNQPAMYAINGLKKGRVIVDKEGWDFLQTNREAISLIVK